jgi:DNA-binding HxlR family transcriptional regulator
VAPRTSPQVCQRFQSAADLLGKRWTALILQQLSEPRRYHELVSALEVVTERMLIQRLKELQRAGVIERRVLVDDHPVGVEYALTDKGRALGRVIGSLQRWAEQWIPETTS